ncbi:nectin-4-like isoform X2 [Cyprinodon tularosa]|uniref:nectin-4-like isoform X2 n=1 Tax=Cyprinodon tularosa TaxID=77115 RepID=UPI0018E23DFE|nr:nectin-4-like isoform X2 [Cyprinodon tularosa]
MTSLLYSLLLGLLVLQIFVTGIQGESKEDPSKLTLQSLEEKETVLPCLYEQSRVSIVQVSWYKIKSDGTKEQIITASPTDGQMAFGTWDGRVRFKSSQPTVDWTLVIISTKVSDEGNYMCHISTFPTGNFEKEMSLTVWTTPITDLVLHDVKEGDTYKQVASCRSVARPPPRLSWDTELNGRSENRTSESGQISINYYLHPVRGMNGKKLDCLVWHPAFSEPRRLKSVLVVHFPPHAEVSGYSEDWQVGMENAALRCIHGGNPAPTVTWTRLGGVLPKHAVPHSDGRLVFERPLNISDMGTYQCLVKNTEGKYEVKVEITLKEHREEIHENKMMYIVGGAAGGLLIVMLILVIVLTCHHKQKNKKLKRELTKKREEISNLSRQASFRRVNSVSTDAREIEESLPLRVESTLRNSLSSLGEQARCRDSRSTISGVRVGGGSAYDSLGRPSIYNNSRRGRDRAMVRDDETQLRIEQFVRNSNMSLQETRLLPPLIQGNYPTIRSTEVIRKMNGSAIIPANGGSHTGSTIKSYQPPPTSSTYPQGTYDEDEIDEGLGGPINQEHPDDQDSVASSSNFSKNRMSPPALSHNPHTSYVHKAQIV